VRTTVTIRRGALLAAAAMACAAVGPPTQAFDLVALARDALPRALVASAYPFDPWVTPVHLPTPGDLTVPPAPPPPAISGPTDPTNPIGTGTGALPGSDLGIPVNVLAAYIAAADTMTQRAPSCGLRWEMLAGIGRVESQHAAGGNLRSDGTTVTPIIGPALTGGGSATQTDTDHGRYDRDTRWDHAVGPMQFLPATWRTYGVDGNADGVKDPNNVYDSTLAAAQYLCAGGTNLAVEANLRAALYAYNPSASYVDTVLSWIRAYQRTGGIPVLPTPTTSFPTPTPSTSTTPPTPTPSPSPSQTQRPSADHKSPSKPANIRVIGHTGTSVSLAWGAARDNVAVTAYEVFRGGNRIATVSGTKLTVNGLAPDHTYTFRVRARDAAGNRSAFSVPVTVLTDVTPPSAPAGFEIVQQNRDSLQIRWSAASDNVDSSPTYLVFVRDPSGAIAGGARVTINGTTAAVTGLSAGTPYTVELFAIDSNGNRSSAAAATIPADREAPTTPAGLAGVASPPAPGDPAATWSVTLAWVPAGDDVEVTDYVVSYTKAGGQASTLPVPAGDCTPDQATGNGICAATVSGLDADGDYTFTVAAEDAAGHLSPASESITVKTAASGGGATGGSPDPTSAPTDTPTTGPSSGGSSTGTTTPTSGGSSTTQAPSQSSSPSSGGSSTPSSAGSSTSSDTSSSTSSSPTTSDSSSSGSGTSSSTTSSDPAPSTGSTSSTDSTPSATTSTPSTTDSTSSTTDPTSSTTDPASSTTDPASSTTDTTSTTDPTSSTQPSTDPSAGATSTSSPTP
jgi:membrane-bound lytic murein transglycosylase B/chitodextrinase